MSTKYVRDFYGVPAARGRRVTLDGVPGRITSADHRLRIKFDKDKHTSIVHPMEDGLIYLGADGKQMWPKKQEA